MAKKYNGVIFIGSLGAGKDYILGKTRKAFDSVYVDTFVWQVGDYYYKYLSDEIGKSVKYIYDNKPQYRPRLQDIGTTQEIVDKGVAFSQSRFAALLKLDILPIVVGRLPFEGHALQDMGAAVIYVDAGELTRMDRVERRDGRRPTSEMMNHPVEPKLADWKDIADYIINNDEGAGDFDVLYDPDLGELSFKNNLCSDVIPLKIRPSAV